VLLVGVRAVDSFGAVGGVGVVVCESWELRRRTHLDEQGSSDSMSRCVDASRPRRLSVGRGCCRTTSPWRCNSQSGF
jgi:hypothetical protein